MELTTTLKTGIAKGIIELSDDGSIINYVYLKRSRNFINTYETVLAETYVSLIETYNYPIQRIDMSVQGEKGLSYEFDIVVYHDDDHQSPFIIVECKRKNLSEHILKESIERFFKSVYSSFSTSVNYCLFTNGVKQESYKVNIESRAHKPIVTIPFFNKEISIYKYVKGGMLENDNPLNALNLQYSDLNAATESELMQIFQNICGNLIEEGVNSTDELNKLLLCKIVDERKHRENGQPYDFQIIDIITSDDTDIDKKISLNLYRRILALYEEGRKMLKNVFNDDIRLSPRGIKIAVQYLQGINLSKTDIAIKESAFEKINRLSYKLSRGQFVTPRSIVDFIVNAMPISPEYRIIDTSCGSGNYLIRYFDRMRKQTSDTSQNNLYGIEIDEQIVRVAKVNMMLHEMDSINVVRHNGLASAEGIAKILKKSDFGYGSFDLAITTPPFVRFQSKTAYFAPNRLSINADNTIQIRENQPTEVLFIEQNFKYLKDGGLLAIIVPDGLLFNPSLQYARNEIESIFRIVAIIGLPSHTFMPATAVKCTLLILKKMTEGQRAEYQDMNYDIFMAIVKSIKANYLDKIGIELKEYIASILTGNRKYHKSNLDDQPFFFIDKKELEQNWSPLIYQNRFHFDSNYKCVKLRTVVDFNPQTPLYGLLQDDEIQYVSLTNKEISFKEVKRVSETKKFRLFQNGDLICSLKNCKSAVVSNAKNGYGCGSDLIVIRTNNALSSDYLYVLLQDEKLIQTAQKNASGSEDTRISMSFFENLEIPLPPLQVQNEIVELYNSAIIERDKKFREAEEIMERAKNQVETMITGKH